MSLDHIGHDADITLITAIPGSGKTLRLVTVMKQFVDRGELVFACNINGLKLPHIPFENPRDWKEVPTGGILFVDEAQNWFRTRRGGDVPPYLTDMETIRHLGIRLVLATQQPDYLDTHLRGLVGLHEHLVRVNGKERSKIYRHHEVMDNVRSDKARSRFDSEDWDFPQANYDLYTSAQVHTRKKTTSSRMKRGMLLGVGALACVLYAGNQFLGFFGGGSKEAQTEASRPAAGGDASGPAVSPQGGNTLSAMEKHTAAALGEYYANLQPRSATLPWSAPIYDGRAPVAEPRTFCITSEAGTDANGRHAAGGYTCLTEQGTRVVMDEAQAAALARHGEPYNPFRNPAHVQHQQHESVYEREPQRPRVSEPVPVFAGGGAGTVGAPGVDPTFGTITRATP